MATAEEQPFMQNLLVLEERGAMLALAPALEKLADRCEQPGAMHWLPYFLDPGVLGRRVPRLVLFLQPAKDATQQIFAEDLQAAVLYFEYEFWGLRTGVVATGDAVGFNTVIAVAHHRAEVAAVASGALLQRGAHSMVTTFEVRDELAPGMLPATAAGKKLHWAIRTRKVPRMLRLRGTLDDTLRQMGKTTRWNLRYYRRRLEKQIACDFVAHAAPLLEGADLERLNAESLNPVPPDEFQRRIKAATELPGSFLCGLRTRDGRWLSLVGGWRQSQTTVLYWQMNASGLEKHSLGTVMRSFFIEAEIAEGARTLLIYGGTPHSMRHAFTEDTVVDMLVQRPGLRTLMVRHLTSLLLLSRLLSRGSFVAEALSDFGPSWTMQETGPGLDAAPLLKQARTQRAA